ncbi:MAG: tRNA pseudouridine(38-40) synthase TruA [Gammaproteobacteria bacterium]|nr:tRNA pseudouridine(38-40) synthase TruA [Gammaproteobacteria bacterium]
MARGQRRFRLTLHYDGTHFFGWQKQPEVRTVQGELQATLERLTGEHRAVTAAGRTDRGVHATGQVVALVLPRRWSAATLRRALNARLPGDIWVADARAAPPAFHPRYDATAREYGYRLGFTAAARSPFHRAWCWPLARLAGDTASTTADLDVEALHAAAALLPGEKSFAAFARAGQEHRGDRCTVTEARWAAWELGMEFTIVADRFLHHMVRYLVGTMVDIARGRRPLDDMRAMLEGNRDGLVTSPPAPATGLFLRRVSYPAQTVARTSAVSDAAATETDDAATPADARPRSPRSVPFADLALLDSDTDRPPAGSANHP